MPEYFAALSDGYTVSVSKNSFVPIKINKRENYFDIIPIIPFINIEVDFLVVSSRKDISFELETDVW